LNAITVAVAGLAGLTTGAAARPAITALAVPTGHQRRTCTSCGSSPQLPRPSTLHRTLRGRCANCGHPAPPAAALPELLGAASFSLIAASGATGWHAAALYWLTACGLALALIDFAVHRLPDALTFPASIGTLALLLIAGAAGESGSAARSLEAAGLLTALFFVTALAGGIGLGDVKLAPALGAILGWISWPALLLGSFASFLLAASTGLVLLTIRRVLRRHARIAFGPAMMAATLGASLLLH